MRLGCLLDKLNQYITVGSENFTGGKYYGLAYQATREDQLFPVTLKDGKTEISIGLDDSYPIIVYHRLLGKNFVKDQYDHYTAQCQMVMVVFGMSQRLQMDTDTLESHLIALFPEKLTKADITGLDGLAGVRFVHGQSNLNAQEVFALEYRNTEYRISGDEHILFSHRYQVDVAFQKNCLDFCERADIPKDLCDWLGISSAQEIVNCLSEEQTAALQEALCEVSCDDANVFVKNSVGSTLKNEPAPSGVNTNITLDDVVNIDSDGSEAPTPAGVPFTCTPQSKAITIVFNPIAATHDTSGTWTNLGTTATFTAISDDGSSGTITVSVNGGSFVAFVNPTAITNGQTLQVRRTVTTGIGTVTLTGTRA